MLNPEDIFVMDLDALHEDLYRMGNTTSPKFNEARAMIDCRVVDRSGIKTVVANGNGFSAFNRIIPLMRRPGSSVWRIKKGSVLPSGLRLVKDLTNEGHYMLAPTSDMPLKKFLGLLEEIAMNPLMASRMTTHEVNNAS